VNGAAADIVTISGGPASENCLPPGTRLGEFEIRGVIGEGGFGVVYLAFDESLQRTVAIKEYMPAMLASRGEDNGVTVRAKQHQETFAKGLRSFINEARLLAQFDHPALIKVYRFWEQNNTGYMAMRYYQGKTLKRIVNDTPSFVTETSLRAILKQILKALETLYRENILHRDISPDNIMIQDNGQAVLLDFGSARQIISDMTQALTVVLKPGYAPVEQYADDDSMIQGPWTDIYSLAAVMYFAIVRKAPPTSVGRMIKDPIETLQNGNYAGFSSGFLAAIDKGLGIRPEERPQSIAEFRALLDIGASAKQEASTASPMDRSAIAKAVGEKSGKTSSSSIKKPTSSKRPDEKQVTHASPLPKIMLGVAGAGLLLIVAAAVHRARHPPPVAQPQQIVVPAQPLVDDETLAWDQLDAKANATPEDIENYLQRYPQGKHAGVAKARLDALKSASAAASAPEAVDHSASASASEKPESAMVAVKLIVKPWGNVFVDGMYRGVSPPLKTLMLPSGKHQVRIDNPNFPAHIMEMDASDKKKVKIEYDFNNGKK
jgi:hypothetical protein